MLVLFCLDHKVHLYQCIIALCVIITHSVYTKAMEFVLGELYAHTHIHRVYYTHTHKVMMDKEVGTGYVRTMSLLFDTRTDTHTQSHSHIQML